MTALHLLITHLRTRLETDEGFSTAELLANAAMAVGAVVAIWAALEALGVNVVNYIGQRILGA